MPDINEARSVLSTAKTLREQDAAASLAAFERAVSLAASTGDRELEADAEYSWGMALFGLGRQPESLPHFLRAIALGAGTDIEANSWLIISDVFLVSEDLERALAADTLAMDLFKALGNLSGEGIAHVSHAQLLHLLKHDDEALPDLARAEELALALKDDNPPAAARLSLSLGELLLQLDRKEEASPVLTRAVEMFRMLGDFRLEARALTHLLAIGYEASGYSQSNFSIVERLMELAAEMGAQEGDPQLEGIAHHLHARLLEEQDTSEGNHNV